MLHEAVGKDLVDSDPVVIIRQEHRLNVMFQFAFRIIMKGQQAGQILIFNISDAVRGRNMNFRVVSSPSS